jgi:hypothetical protein
MSQLMQNFCHGDGATPLISIFFIDEYFVPTVALFLKGL